MNRVLERFREWTPRQRWIAAGGGLATMFILVLMLHMATAKRMALLYSGLDEATAGEVISVLDADGFAYEVRGRSVFVEEAQRDRLRLQLARQNLPSPAADGYELLDGLDSFSTTSEMFSVTYWRAKEGELARTLMSMPGIKTARVHIGAEDRGAFSRRDSRRTASVTVSAPRGLDKAQIEAIRYMTALAVPDLPASDVAVIDSARGLLTSEGPQAQLNDTRRAEALERDLLALLEARVGPGNARVNVAMEFARRREEVAEHAVDPASAVITESIREESNSRETGQDRAVTVASDLPDGEDTGTSREAENSERREEVAYAVSTTDRKIEILPGAIERLSVAVLLNEVAGEDGNTVPRTSEELAALESLVAAAAGINRDRGDSIIIRSLPFDRPEALPDTPQAGWAESLGNSGFLGYGVLGLSLLLFGLFVLRPILTSATPAASEPLLLADDDFAMAPMDIAPLPEPENPVDVLRERSAERPDAAATLLNAWLDDKEDAA